MIFVDHIHGNFWRHFTYQNFGLSDAAEIFVLLSGLACGIAYGRTLRLRGWLAAQARVLRRAGRIYVGYLIACGVFIAIGFAVASRLTGDGIAILDLAPLLADPVRAVLGTVDFMYAPYILYVLPLYILLLPLTVVALFSLWRAPLLSCAVSLGLWVLVQFEPGLNLPSLLSTSTWPMNPFAWQLLFFIGLALGWRYYQAGSTFVPRVGLVRLAALVVALGLVVRLLHSAGAHFGGQIPLLDAVYEAGLGSTAKTNLSALRLCHFLAVVYLVAAWCTGREPLFRTVWARPLVLCGQHSLELFCVSVILNLVASVWILLFAPQKLAQLAITLAGCAVLWLCAWLISQRGRRFASVTRERRLGEGPTAVKTGSG
jgi:hypothetical protein